MQLQRVLWEFNCFLILLFVKELDMSLSEIVEDILNMHDTTKVGICYSSLVIFIH